MAILRIHCRSCGGKWEVYSRDNWKGDNARKCPHCFKEIPRDLWENDVIPAFCEVIDANAELYKDHTGNHRPLFSFDVMANKTAPQRRAERPTAYNPYRDCPNLD